MESNIICSRCGAILKETGTTQNGKYKTCENCKLIQT
jgi:DNA-directed RNA polymerase subunit RPC12/RpoP